LSICWDGWFGLVVNGFVGRMNAGVTPPRTNHGLLSLD
jgi:hypothetical protein